MSNNLILGWLYDRSLPEIEAFLVSTIRAKPNAKIVILGGYTDGGEYTYKGIRDLGIELIEVPHGPESEDKTHFISRRYCWIDWYLKQHPEYERVILTGIRDVIIQSDPFVYDSGNALCCFLESKLIGECSWNRMWLSDIYGIQEAEKLYYKPISCNEIIMGNYNRITEYVSLMASYICKPDSKPLVIDQGVHNYLLWNDMLGEVQLFKPGEGVVYTMGYVITDNHGKEIFKLNDKNQVLNNDGSVVPMIHQYDRSGTLNTILRDIYTGVKIMPTEIGYSRYNNRSAILPAITTPTFKGKPTCEFVIDMINRYGGEVANTFLPLTKTYGGYWENLFDDFDSILLYSMCKLFNFKVVTEASPGTGWTTLMIQQGSDFLKAHTAYEGAQNEQLIRNNFGRAGLPINNFKYVIGDFRQTVLSLEDSDFIFIDSEHSLNFAKFYTEELHVLDLPGKIIHIHDMYPRIPNDPANDVYCADDFEAWYIWQYLKAHPQKFDAIWSFELVRNPIVAEALSKVLGASVAKDRSTSEQRLHNTSLYLALR